MLPMPEKQTYMRIAYTYIYKSSLMLSFPPSVFFLSSPTISDHRKTTRSENDRFHSVLSSVLYWVRRRWVFHVCCSMKSDLLAIRCACMHVRSLTLYGLHTLYAFDSLSRESRARKDAEGQPTQKWRTGANHVALTIIDVYTYETGKTQLTSGWIFLYVVTRIVFFQKLSMQTNI
jgi:hypothetical protein